MKSNTSMPLNRIIPVLNYPDVNQAINWLIEILGFSVRIKIGDHRAQMNIGADSFAITKGEFENNHCNSIMIRIEEIEKYYKRLNDLNANITSDLTEYPFGEKQFSIKDYAGHIWTFSESVEDVQPEEWGGKAINLT